MEVYSDFGWSLPRGEPPPADPPVSEPKATQVADNPTQPPPTIPTIPTIPTEDADNYFVIERQFDIVVIRILILSAKIVAIVAILTFVLSALYKLIVELRFIAQNVAAELVPFGIYFVSIVAVAFTVYYTGRAVLSHFFD